MSQGVARRVREAMHAVDRRWFLPDDVRGHAGVDAPLPIGHGATCSQPHGEAGVNAGKGWRVATAKDRAALRTMKIPLDALKICAL